MNLLEIHGFLSYLGVLTPIYILVTLVGIWCFASWMNGQLSFLESAFVSGMFGYVTTPIVHSLNVQAQGELGTLLYSLLALVSFVLWVLGLMAFFAVRTYIVDVYWRFRMKVRQNVT